MPGNPTRTGELNKFGRSKVMRTGIMALNTARGTLCLALENRAVGGRSKSGAMTIASTAAINTKPTNLTQRFILTTLNNLCSAASRLSTTEAGQPGLLAPAGRYLRFRYRTATPFQAPADGAWRRFRLMLRSRVETRAHLFANNRMPIWNIRCCSLSFGPHFSPALRRSPQSLARATCD